MSHVIRFGIDLAKNTFALCGVDEHDHIIVKKTLTRKQLLPFFANAPTALIAMEADSGAHHWARQLINLGHDARIIDPGLVAPYRQQSRTGKNDDNAFKAQWPRIRQQHNTDLPPLAWHTLDARHVKLDALHQQILAYDRQIKAFVRADERASRLTAVHGIGVITASALVATIGNGYDFRNGRCAVLRPSLSQLQRGR